MEKILITGGTGLTGTHLSKKLLRRGYRVSILSRTTAQGTDAKVYHWNPDSGSMDESAVDDADCIIHLAGESIGGKRWTPSQKQEIIDSRIKSAQLIFNTVKKRNKNLKTFISASATGYYGSVTSEKIFAENDPPANDFLGNTCRLWEQTAEKFKDLGVRVVNIRTSPVLAKKSGVLEKIITPVKLGLGSPTGTGRQYFPWIHIDDLCSIYIKSVEDTKMAGAYNAAAPDHKTNEEFMRTLAEVMKKPFRFPNVPALLIKIVFGEMGNAVLYGSRISPEKIRKAGYEFLFPDLKGALQDLLGKKQQQASVE